ncbi:MAG TPA: endonuclease domain-containing protein [Allosphingosinicella sp.]|nr:endonuclease domain-containing protein [Allosphingosinicella sp.]
MPPVKRQVSRYAAPLRRAATDAEQRLWSRLRNRQLMDCKFRFQHSVGPYVADFACLERMLIVEIDGGQHDEKKDRVRTRYLTSHGFRIVRYWNNDVLQNTDGVLQSLVETLREP